MYIQLYRKSDQLLLLEVGKDELHVQDEINKVVEALKKIGEERKLVKLDNCYLTCSAYGEGVVIVSDERPQETLIHKIEEYVQVNIGSGIGRASKKLQLSGYADGVSDVVRQHESQSQLELLQAEVAGTHQLVAENLESVVRRGNSLAQMEDTSVEILQNTRELLQTSKEIDLQAFWRKNMTYIVAGVVCILVLYILFR